MSNSLDKTVTLVRKLDGAGYRAGRSAGDDVGLDKQVDQSKRGQLS